MFGEKFKIEFKGMFGVRLKIVVIIGGGIYFKIEVGVMFKYEVYLYI